MRKRAYGYTFFDRLRDAVYARYERLFPTPVQVRLIEILGGTTITIGGIRRNNRQLTLTISRGKLLRSAKFRRMVLDGRGVLANDIMWAIAVQGSEYERDVVSAYERDERLRAAGWRLAYVNVRDVWTNPASVRNNILQFLA
jgi:very-short-patch-repair endonuclease